MTTWTRELGRDLDLESRRPMPSKAEVVASQYLPERPGLIHRHPVTYRDLNRRGWVSRVLWPLLMGVKA